MTTWQTEKQSELSHMSPLIECQYSVLVNYITWKPEDYIFDSNSDLNHSPSKPKTIQHVVLFDKKTIYEIPVFCSRKTKILFLTVTPTQLNRKTIPYILL